MNWDLSNEHTTSSGSKFHYDKRKVVSYSFYAEIYISCTNSCFGEPDVVTPSNTGHADSVRVCERNLLFPYSLNSAMLY